jgi:chromate transport protein ChrA
VSRPSVVLLVWSGILLVLAIVLLAWTQSALVNGLLFGAAALTGVLAVVALAVREPRRRVVPDVSLATAVTGIGVALALAGSAFGVWLVLIGAGVVVLGLSGIVKERTGT